MFQEMLNVLDVIGKKHAVSISNVAVRVFLLIRSTYMSYDMISLYSLTIHFLISFHCYDVDVSALPI